MWRLIEDQDIEIHDIEPLAERILRVCLKDKKEKCKQPVTNNVPLGAMVTSYARLHLYNGLQRVKKTKVYADTDSILFKHKIGNPLPILEDPFLGGFTREYADYIILEYISAGKIFDTNFKKFYSKFSQFKNLQI